MADRLDNSRPWLYGQALRIAWALGAALFASSPLQAQPTEPQLPNDPRQVEQLDAYLARLDLTDLRIAHLERIIHATDPGTERLRWAKLLADLYAQQLASRTDDLKAFEDLSTRVARLLELVPEARTPSLSVTLLQADYRRAERLIEQSWMGDGDETTRREASDLFRRIATKLDEHFPTLNAAAEASSKILDDLADGPEREAMERQWQQQQLIAARAAYFDAWSHYFLARTTDDTDEVAKSLERARQLFRHLLGLEGELDLWEAEDLGLESIWRSRALIGLALCESLAGETANSSRCFQWLNSPSVPPTIRDQLAYWKLESWLATDRISDIVEFARDEVNSWPTAAGQGRISFCVRLIHASQSWPEDLASQGTELGMIGLVKMRQFSLAEQLADKHGLAPLPAGNLYLDWFNGRWFFGKAEKTNERIYYEEAVNALVGALRGNRNREDPQAAAECLYLLGWAQYRLDQFEKAARIFEEAASALKSASSPQAAEAAWMAYVAYQKLIPEQRRFIPSAIAALERVQRDFPDHSYARRAGIQLTKLQQDRRSIDALLKELESVPAESAEYLASRYEICRILYQQWRTAQAARKQELAESLLAAASQVVSASKGSQELRLAECCIQAAEAAMGLGQLDRAKAMLDRAQPVAQQLAPGNLPVLQYHYQRLRLAMARNEHAEAQSHAAWLAEQGRDSPYEIPALVTLAKIQDRALREASEETRTQRLEEAFRAYDHLSKRLGQDPATLAREANARVACYKVADYGEQLGRTDEATAAIAGLLAAFPREEAYLRLAGLIHYRAGRYAKALESWRLLLAGLKKGSDAWQEAKYYQLACLKQVDTEQGRKVWRQFQLLYPNSGSSEWGKRIAVLAEDAGW